MSHYRFFESHRFLFFVLFINTYWHCFFQESSGPGLVRFSASEMGESELGRIVEDRTVQVRLHIMDATVVVATCGM